MPRGKRGRPLLASKPPYAQEDVGHEEIPMVEDVDRGDDVDEFIAERHAQMTKEHDLHQSDSNDDGNEHEMRDVNVLNIEASDSDDSQSDLLDEEDDENTKKDDWGGRKKNWYGGDTHEYEIMEEDEREELLLDEEEEAIRLQMKTLRRARLEDYGQDDDDESGRETEEDDENQKAGAMPVELGKDGEDFGLELLAEEFRQSLDQLYHFKDRILTSEANRIKYQLLSLFVSNVAVYFSFRTDPDSVGLDLRSHPVLHRIVQVRSLLQEVKALPVEKLTKGVALNDTEHDEVQEVERNEASNSLKNGSEKQNEKKQAREADPGKGKHSENAEEQPVGTAKDTKARVHHRPVEIQRKVNEKRKKKQKKTKLSSAVEADEERIMSILPENKRARVANEEEAPRDRKRKKLNKIVGAMERERKNDEKKRMVSADLDHIREEIGNKSLRNAYKLEERSEGAGREGSVDDDVVMRKMLAKREKKEARKARNAAESKPHVYTFKDEVYPDEKRKASSQVVKNRGLTRYRPRDKKTPRTKNRQSYHKAVIRRKGAVKEYDGVRQANYAGEASGINMSARKSSML